MNSRISMFNVRFQSNEMKLQKNVIYISRNKKCTVHVLLHYFRSLQNLDENNSEDADTCRYSQSIN